MGQEKNWISYAYGMSRPRTGYQLVTKNKISAPFLRDMKELVPFYGHSLMVGVGQRSLLCLAMSLTFLTGGILDFANCKLSDLSKLTSSTS